MKKITKLFCAGLAMVAFAGNALAQNPNFCHTDEMVRRSLDLNPA